MASITMQRDLVVNLKEETNFNITLLHKLHPMFPELSRSIFKENALEKPTKTLFNNLSYYLVAIIDPHLCISITWPLYDTKAERSYRNELSNFITIYGKKGLVTPIMSSYFVNPGCFKVTVLLFELSKLAIDLVLNTKLVKESQKNSYKDMTEKYNSQSIDLIECVNRESQIIHSKFLNYLSKRKTLESIAELLRKKVTEMEISTNNAQQFINKLVDDFVLKNNLEDTYKTEIVKIKDVNEHSIFFNLWLTELDSQLDIIETNWDRKVTPYLKTCQNIVDYSKSLINKHTGQTEISSYMIEYNPNDKICTKDLQSQVNSQQQFILRNLEVDGKLSFPNLIRAFVISISIALKNSEINDDVYKFNTYLENGRRNYSEFVSALKLLLRRVLEAENKLQQSPAIYRKSSLIQKKHSEIPPLPDISDLNTNYAQFQTILDSFTPLNRAKQHFNLMKSSRYFVNPQPKLIAPMYQATSDNFLRSLTSCHIAYDNLTVTQNNPNISIISSIRGNETIAECSSGFTKQQILRLLSTKKSSSSKKHKFNYDRPNIKIKKGGLFSDVCNENSGLYRSYSSPNLCENKEKRSYSKGKNRKLSIMQEDSVSHLELSGIACLDMASSLSTPQSIAGSSRKEDASNEPIARVEERINNVITNIEAEMNMFGTNVVSPILEVSINDTEEKIETPKTNTHLIKKTSSLEKIINRFKKVRANVMQETEGIISIAEEKENVNAVNTTSFKTLTNRVLLPDLLNPSCSKSDNKQSVNYLDQLCQDMDKYDLKRPRDSLGTALGVDQTFLDQFNLIE